MTAKRPRLLIVDDERAYADILAEVLQDEGYHVLCAYDGLQALRILEEDPPDLVVTDVMMPRISGAELVRRAREIHPPDRLPFVLLSAGPDPRIREDHVVFLPKPLEFEALLAQIERAVETAA